MLLVYDLHHTLAQYRSWRPLPELIIRYKRLQLKNHLNSTYKLEVSALLYKYMKPERIEFFENASLRFTPPMDLNDPFECRPIVKFKDPEDYINQVIKRNLKNAPKLLMKRHPNLTYPEAVKAVKIAKKKMKQDFMQNIETELTHELEILMRNINKHIGILSLTEDPFNTSMWAHYASSGSGYAIELDESNQFFHRLPSDAQYCGEITPVKYTDQLIKIEFESTPSKINPDLLFTKKKYWSYEREHRIIQELSKADRVKKIYTFTKFLMKQFRQ